MTKAKGLLSAIIDLDDGELEGNNMEEVPAQATETEEGDDAEMMEVGAPTTSSTQTAMEFLLGEKNKTVQKVSELDTYFRLPTPGTDSDPLQWWRLYKKDLQKLSSTARKYLSIPATSVPSERIFSVAGNIVSAKRNRLSPENVNKLVFLNHNLKE